MKTPKNKKSRAVSAIIEHHYGGLGLFYMPQPYDKKDRFIPSSVHCAFNSMYYTESDVAQMLKAL